MNQFFYQITRKASDLINSDDYRERNITRQTAFTRNRKLSFPVMIVLLLNFLTRTMQIELDDFFANVLDAGTDSVTKQAFFKARKNILPDAFKELFLMTRDMVLNKNKIKRHKGYRILAIDGSELRLDKTKENKDIFLPRNHSPENKTNAEISLLYDVISHYVIDAQIGSIGVCEREYAKKNLAHFSSICDEKDIVIFDRGYPSRDMIATLTGMGCKYLMRLQASCFKGVKENPSNDFRITVSTKTDTYSVRVVRVILKSGEIETLITNLSEDEFSADDFLDLYFLRWDIETTYDTLKNKLLIEKFSGRSPVAVLQEYYAMMFVLNCIAAMSAEEILANADFANDITTTPLEDNVTALQQLELGFSDAVFMDSVVANYLITSEGKDFVILPEGLEKEEYAIGFRKGDQALRDEVQNTLSELKADGTLGEISTKWFGSDITTVK